MRLRRAVCVACLVACFSCAKPPGNAKPTAAGPSGETSATSGHARCTPSACDVSIRSDVSTSTSATSTSTSTPAPASSPSPSPAPTPAPRKLAPLDAPEMRAVTTNKSKAFVVAPHGATEPRPVVIGAHGAGDRADWSCTEWAATLGSYAWVICPEGVPSQWPGYQSWGSAEQLAARADAAVALVREEQGAYVDDGPRIFGGWSLAATLAASVVALRKGTYGSAILVEVGHTPLDANVVVRDLRAAGVSRAVVSCSSGPCRDFTSRFTVAARKQGLAFRTNDVGLRGHWFDEPVFRSLGPIVAWTVDADPRWDGLDASVRARWGDSVARSAQ